MRFGWYNGKREFLTLLLIYKCQGCGCERPENKIYSYVDGNNKAITKHSKLYCADCFRKYHGE